MKYKEIVLDARRLASAGAFIMAFVFEEDAEPVVMGQTHGRVAMFIRTRIQNRRRMCIQKHEKL